MPRFPIYRLALRGAEAEIKSLQDRNDELTSLLQAIERNLREDAAPILDLINEHGTDEQKRAWRRGVYGPAIRIQVVLSINRPIDAAEAA